MSKPPRVRFAPSPTGYLHIGGARTALFNWLHARHHGGTFVLRMEDTDQERSTPQSVQAILDALIWLGIDWDEGPIKGGPKGPYFQMQRLNTYKETADALIASGKAYRCFCTREDIEARRKEAEAQKRAYKYEGTCRERKDDGGGKPYVLRFKMPRVDGSVGFTDLIKGRITKTYSDLDDWVMMRGDGIPLYNFGCVVDDHLMDITLVGRGEEHINSTLPQLMLYEALGWQPPQFAHFPLILAPDGQKLSKRKHPEADVMQHAKNGILPQALLNYVIRLGWSHGDDEVFSREQMIEWFSFEGVGSSNSKWDADKLMWLNQHYLKSLPVGEVASQLATFLARQELSVAPTDPRLARVTALMRDRWKTLGEMASAARYFFSKGVTLDEKAAAKHLTKDTKPLLEKVVSRLEGSEWTAAAIEVVVKAVSEEAQVGMGKVAQPIRVAVTGNVMSPGIGDTLELVGKDESFARLRSALSRIG